MKDKLKSSSLSSTLKSLVDQLGELNDIQQKSIESGRGSADTMVHKAMEDGILDRIYDANSNQLTFILESYRFQYYTEFNKDRSLLRREVQRRLRDRKLEELGI
jgi:hypothetical protein